MTSRTDDELRTFLRSISHRYTMETYDLFNNNCNNFSNEVSKFLLNGKTIPETILEVPGKFLATPMGTMIGQMMKNMQSTMGANMGSNDPFTAMATSRGNGNGIVPSGTENFNESTNNIKTSLASSDGSLPSIVDKVVTNLLTTHIRPLVSNEVYTVPVFIRRLHLINGNLPMDSPHRLTVDQITVLNELPKYLQSSDTSSHDDEAPVCTPDGVCTLPSKRRKEDTRWQQEMVNLCIQLYHHWPHNTVLFPLFGLLRLLILRDDCLSIILDSSLSVSNGSNSSSSSSSSNRNGGLLWDIMETLHSKNGYTGTSNASAVGINTIALSCLANLFGTSQGTQWVVKSSSILNTIIDITLHYLHYESSPGVRCPEIRQISSALMYNITNNLPIGSDTNPSLSSAADGMKEGNATVQITDISIQLLCAIFDNIGYDDHDDTTLERLLLSAGRLFSREGFEAMELMNTLGYHDTLVSITRNGNKKYTKRLQSLAAEVQQKLNVSGSGTTV